MAGVMQNLKKAREDDTNKFYRNQYEGRQRLEELQQQQSARAAKTRGLGGKAAAMGDYLSFSSTNASQPDGKNDLKAGDAAYDAVSNINESRQEDEAKGVMRNLREIQKRSYPQTKENSDPKRKALR